MFSIKSKDLGKQRVGKKVVVVYPYENIQSIIGMKASCGCANPTNDINNKQVSVEFTPNPVPKHFAEQNIKSYVTNKTITVVYVTEAEPYIQQTVDLTFTALVR